MLIPGAGAEDHVTEQFSALAGVHRGFAPVAPSASSDVKPESSVNYEAGVRWRNAIVNADVVGFYSDYSNLKGSCTLAAGCVEMMEGREFNGGSAHVWGAEVQAGATVPLDGQLSLPLALAYTYSDSAFQRTFSSEFAGWGDVEKGDELPYLPRHEVTATAGVAHPRADGSITARYRAQARDQAGQGDIPTSLLAESLFTIDLAVHARLSSWAELYATCSNLLDEQVIISRRPYGARPNPPRMVAVGYKARF